MGNVKVCAKNVEIIKKTSNLYKLVGMDKIMDTGSMIKWNSFSRIYGYTVYPQGSST